MDIKNLKSFVCVAKHKSFSKAALELNTVQPAISRHISSLEAEIGLSLFTRSSREVVITQAGEQLLRDAVVILALTENAKTQAKLAHNGQIGSLNIAYLSSACLSFMAGLVQRYKLVYPSVHVTLFEMTATEQIDAFKNEQIDIAFSRPLPNAMNHEYSSHNIYIDKLVAVVNINHPLANKSAIKLSVLKSQPFIIFNRNEALGLFDECITQCKQAGFSPDIVSQPTNMQTLLTEVAAGLGVAIAPYCINKLYIKGCHFIALNNVNTQIPLQVQHKKDEHKATVNAFLDIVLNARNSIQDDMHTCA